VNIPHFISRWFGPDLPPIKQAVKKTRAKKRPWISDEAYAAFASADEVQGEGVKEKLPA
jgi:ribosomal protein L20A (L18A)